MVQITLENDEALVLFEFLSRFEKERVLSIEHEGERTALWNLLCLFEKELTEPFKPEYLELVAAARERLRFPDDSPS